MRRVVALAAKDLRLLARDRFGLFWVLFFPLLMALFFGSIFSGGGSGSRGMKIGFAGEGDSTRVAHFRAALAASEALDVRDLPVDSARDLVGRGRLSAYVRYVDTSGSVFGLLGPERPSIEVGMDPARRAEAGYLRGLVTQAYFRLLRESMMNPGALAAPLREQVAALDSVPGLPGPERRTLKKFLASLADLLETVQDTAASGKDTAGAAAAGGAEADTAAAATAGTDLGFGEPDIRFEDVVESREGPRSTWEITFPQSLQWALIGVCAAFAVSIVVERRRGTFLRLRMAPLRRGHILAGKGLACFTAGVTASVLLLGFGILVFGVRVSSPWGLLAAVLAAAFSFVGLMMFISVLGRTEQAVAGAGWAILLVMSMTGGGMLPLFLMPSWLQKLSAVSVVKWSVLAMEGAIWRGFGPADMAFPIAVLLAVGVSGFAVGTAILVRTD